MHIGIESIVSDISSLGSYILTGYICIFQSEERIEVKKCRGCGMKLERTGGVT